MTTPAVAGRGVGGRAAASTPATPLRQALIIAGPTCSGKSALALHLARQLGATIVNADSMQVYRELRILTARPTPEDEAQVPHALYGVRPAAEPGNAAWWRAEALTAMNASRVPILCGGTGLYLAALTQGLSDIPDPGPAARAQARLLLAEHGPARLHAMLTEADPATAATLRPTDPQRLARAWEVLVGTGTGLAAHRSAAVPPGGWQFRMILLNPPRPVLREAIAVRFHTMIEAGAIEEVAGLHGLDPALPAMRAHGVPELSDLLRGRLSLAEAAARAILATGRYTKRQATWFRHRSPVPVEHTHVIHARFAQLKQFSESERLDIEHFIVGLASPAPEDHV